MIRSRHPHRTVPYRTAPTDICQKRQQVKTQLQQAFNDDGLHFRAICTNKERNYFNSVTCCPRPVVHLKQDVQTRAFSMKHKVQTTSSVNGTVQFIETTPVNPEERPGNTPHTFTLTGTKALAHYKCNAMTAELEEKKTTQVSELRTICLPNEQSFTQKITAISDRKLWEVLPPMTSGKLQPSGFYKHPKPLEDYEQKRLIENNEILTTGYTPKNITAIAFDRDNVSYSLSSCLHSHEQCRQTIGLNTPEQTPLNGPPLTIYSPATRSLDVLYRDEICPGESEELLQTNEHYIHQALAAYGANFDSYRQLLDGLSLPTAAHAMCASNWSPEERQQFEKPYRGELAHMLRNPKEYDPATVDMYIHAGVKPHIPYVEQGNSVSPLQILIATVEQRGLRVRRNTPEHQAAITNIPAFFEQLLNAGSPPPKPVSIFNLRRDHWHIADWLVALDAVEFKGSILSSAFYLQDLPQDHHLYALLHERYVEQEIEKEGGNVQAAFYNLLKTNFTDLEIKNVEIFLCFLRRGADPLALKPELIKALEHYQKSHPECYAFSHRTRTPEEVFTRFMDEWKIWQQTPDTEEWQEEVAQGEEAIRQLQQRLAERQQYVPDQAMLEKKFTFLAEAYNQPPEFSTPVGDNESTVLAILKHYYRRPGYQKVVTRLTEPPKTIEKPNHPCSHVLRVRNNVVSAIALLQKASLQQFDAQEQALCTLAALYIHSAQEHVEQQNTAKVAAEYFRRDMAGHPNQSLVNQLASALEQINSDKDTPRRKQPRGKVRQFLHVLRMGERMDSVRHCNLTSSFPLANGTSATPQFDLHTLDLPPALARNPELMQELTAVLHGSADLSCVTGGNPETDARQQEPYTVRHHLEVNNERLTKAFESTPCPLSHMNQMRDNNVRRTIAMRAGLAFCSSKEAPTCRANLETGISFGIHDSFHDLAQVRIPDCMTHLEKMQIEHNWDLLSEPTRTALEREIARLQKDGIEMNLGSLTQTTLQSKQAVPKLLARGLEPKLERRRRGVNDVGRDVYENMHVPAPVERVSLTEQQAAQTQRKRTMSQRTMSQRTMSQRTMSQRTEPEHQVAPTAKRATLETPAGSASHTTLGSTLRSISRYFC